jgi:RP/EB family microtubule-associated protein
MDGTYFVGRSEILAWINGLLSTNYTKIEETASGAGSSVLPKDTSCF